ncbi:MAG: hypothetical protein IKY70_07450, partial [Bacteroidales bacterium]|nr:hypothetical protein [Bacteroidales bacterium]
MKKRIIVLFVTLLAIAVTGIQEVQANSVVTEIETIQQAGEVLNVNPYRSILTEKQFAFNIVSILRGLCGMAVIILISWLISVDRKRINWGTVIKALALQFIIAVSVLMFPAVQTVFEIMGKCFVAVLDWTKAGSIFLF